MPDFWNRWERLELKHLSTVKAILGELLIKDPHLALIQICHHQLQLLVRSDPFKVVNVSKSWFSPAVVSSVESEEMPTVSIDRPHRESWTMEKWNQKKRNSFHLNRHWRWISGRTPPLPSSYDWSRRLNLFEKVPVRARLLSRFHEVPSGVDDSLEIIIQSWEWERGRLIHLNLGQIALLTGQLKQLWQAVQGRGGAAGFHHQPEKLFRCQVPKSQHNAAPRLGVLVLEWVGDDDQLTWVSSLTREIPYIGRTIGPVLVNEEGALG